MKTNQNRTSDLDATIGVVFHRADGTIQSCNPNAEEILGYSAKHLVGANSFNPPWQTIHEDGSLFLPETYPTTVSLRTGQSCSDVIMGFYHPDGNLVWLSIDTLPLFKANNVEPYGVEAIFKEVTAEIKAQTTPKLSPAILPQTPKNRLLTDCLPGIIYVFDVVAGQNIYINSQVYNLLGYTIPEISQIGADFIERVMHPEDLTLFYAHLARLDRANHTEVYKFEYRMRHQNGEWRWFCSQDRVYSRTADGSVKQIIGVARDITNRQQTQLALQESEKRLKLATTASGIGMWFWDLPEDNLEFTEQCKAIFGLPFDANISYERFINILHPEDRDRTQEAVNRALAEQTEYSIEYRAIWSDGSVHWILAKGRGFYDRNGEPVSMMGTVQDITARKESEQQLKTTKEALSQSKQLLRKVLDSLVIYVGILTPDGRLIDVNRTALAAANLKPEEVLNQPFAETYWWSFDPQIQQQLNEAIARAVAGEVVRYDTIVRLGENQFIHNDFSIVPIFNSEGEVEYLIPNGMDISDRKETAAILQQREHELELITEIIPQQVWTALPNGEVDYVNQRWQEYAGATLAEIKGRNWLKVFHPDDLRRVDRVWHHSITTGENYNIEARIRRADGEYCWFIVRARPLRNKRGEIVKWYGTNTSITRIKELESQLIQQTEDLANANRLKDEFLAIVSHELRTPLNPILGWAQMLVGGRLDAEKTAKGIEIIGRNAKLQAQLIEDLLDVSRILRGKLDLNKTPLNLESIIRSALTTVNLAAEAKSIQIETRYEPNIGLVLGDAGRLQQIVWNLVSNAIKFTSQGGQVTIKLERIGSQALIQVQDTGQGIEAEFLPYVFDRFRQAEGNSTRQYGGLGLGLAIVRHLTELHGGTVAVSSPGLDRGSTFSIRLPLVNIPEVEQLEAETNSIVRSVDLSSNRFSGSKILVIDDEADSLDILSFVLEQEGATVIRATSAAEALEAFNRDPDLIISDISMPDVSGYTLMTQIREIERGKNLPAIALTAYAGEVDKQRSIEAGFQKHISKPIDIAELITAIDKLINSAS